MAGNANSGGRNAKSRQQHMTQGTFQPSRHEGKDSPEPPTGHPDQPKTLTGDAKAEWIRMVARLETNKTLTIVDDAALYQYCSLFGETEQIKRDVAALRKDLSDTRSTVKQLRTSLNEVNNLERLATIEQIASLRMTMLGLSKQIAKETGALRQGHMAIRQYLVEFGMTPSARSRVKVAAPPKPIGSSKMSLLMGGKA